MKTLLTMADLAARRGTDSLIPPVRIKRTPCSFLQNTIPIFTIFELLKTSNANSIFSHVNKSRQKLSGHFTFCIYNRCKSRVKQERETETLQ
jgi:hypothetical protein